jgi:LPS sulfotransferase NodH
MREYKKDPEDEKFLEKFNNILAPHQEEDYQELEEVYPTLHVIGAPRSGTTLLMQLIASHLKIGYINNLIATFWKAPVYGIRLSKKLIPPGVNSSYHSDFGRTRGIHEPHEFGYFWSYLLGYKEHAEPDSEFDKKIDWHRVKKVFTNMTHAYGCPIAFKSFLLGWHIKKMQDILPKTCFVWIRRDPLQNAADIIKMRKQFLGSVEEWASLKPKEYSWLKNNPYWKQVVGQVYYLDRAIDNQVQEVKGHNVIEVDYEELCNYPDNVLNKIIEVLEFNGSKVDKISKPTNSFEVIKEENNLESKERELIRQALNEFYY